MTTDPPDTNDLLHHVGDGDRHARGELAAQGIRSGLIRSKFFSGFSRRFLGAVPLSMCVVH
jgi:hypothetical protein